MDNRVIMHVDANSAYLSWEAVNRLLHGDTLDLRTVPSVVGGILTPGMESCSQSRFRLKSLISRRVKRSGKPKRNARS